MTGMDRFVFAGFRRRFGAWCIDSLVLFLLLMMLAVVVRLLIATRLWIPAHVGVAPEEIWNTLAFSTKLFFLLTFVISLGPFYYAIFHASPWQATLGKLVLNIYVTDNDGNRISIGRGLRRWFTNFALSWFCISIVSVATIIATPERKALHDYVAKTLVLQGRVFPAEPFRLWRIIAAFVLPFLSMLTTFIVIL